MLWSNASLAALEIRCSRIALRHARRARWLRPGHWRVLRTDGVWLPARLEHAWLTGRVAGLAWRGADGRRYVAAVLAARQTPAGWRRLRVKLRLPGA